MEVAPGVVDATAVALPSAPNVITYVVESDEPVFDPSDSDEEADLQGPTLVDSDDEPMVSVGRFTPWLQADSALSVAGTAIDSAQPTFSSTTCRAFSGCSECNVTQRVGLTQIDSDNELLVTIEEGTTVPEAFDHTIVDSESDGSMTSFVRVHRGGRRVFEEDVVQQIRAGHTAAERATPNRVWGGDSRSWQRTRSDTGRRQRSGRRVRGDRRSRRCHEEKTIAHHLAPC